MFSLILIEIYLRLKQNVMENVYLQKTKIYFFCWGYKIENILLYSIYDFKYTTNLSKPVANPDDHGPSWFGLANVGCILIIFKIFTILVKHVYI